MRILGLTITRAKKTSPTDEARAKSLEVRRLKKDIEIKKLSIEMAKLDAKVEAQKKMDPRIKAFIDDPEKGFMMMMAEKFLTNAATDLQKDPINVTPDKKPKELDLTDEQIDEMVNKLDDQAMAYMATKTDQEMAEIIKGYIPNMSKSCSDRVIVKIKEFKKK